MDTAAGIYLSPEDFPQFVRLQSEARREDFHLIRPEHEGAPFLIERHHRIWCELADLEAVADWLRR